MTPTPVPEDDSLGYERMFFKYHLYPSGHRCTRCGINFPTFTDFYSHRELWHGKPISSIIGITTIGDTSV